MMWGNSVNYYNLMGCVVVFLLAVLIESLMIPRVLLISKKKRLFDIPDYRKIHSNPIPRLAGATFLPAMMLSIFPLLCIQYLLFPDLLNDSNPSFFISLCLIFCGAILLLLVGVKDDLIGVKYSHKFIYQLIASLFLVGSGNKINFFYGILGIEHVHPVLGILFTLLLTVSIINAINLIDGVDGLAGILISIAAAVLGIYFVLGGLYNYAYLAFSIVGIIVPFLMYNFSSRRKMFMGDTGSLIMGYILSLLTVRCCMLSPEASTGNPLPIVIAASVLFIPLFDTIRVFAVRGIQRKPMFYPDKNHIHHKLLELGCSHLQVCMVLAMITLVHLAMNIALYRYVNVNLLFVINVGLGVMENLFLNYRSTVQSSFKTEPLHKD